MKKKFLLYLGVCLLIMACNPQGAEYYEDLDLVYTNYDDSFEFANQRTYSIPNQIVKVTGNLAEGEDPQFVQEPYRTEMLEKIKSNMTNLGWEEVVNPADADLVLLPAVWTNTTIYYWYDYWCWYYPFYCGYGWSYPVVTAQTSGTLVMTLITDGENSIDPIRVWTAAANGLLSGAFNTNRVTKAIDQAFEQSPYLDVN